MKPAGGWSLSHVAEEDGYTLNGLPVHRRADRGNALWSVGGNKTCHMGSTCNPHTEKPSCPTVPPSI